MDHVSNTKIFYSRMIRVCVLAGFQAPAVRRDGHAQPVWQHREQCVCRAGWRAGPGAWSQLWRGLRRV